jgi:hypothetical protein
MTQDNGTPTPAAETPPAEQQTTEQAGALKPVEPAVKGTKFEQPMPDRAPIPGTKFVLNPETGLYDVENLTPEVFERAVEQREEEGPGEPTVDEAAGQAAAEAVRMPEILPEAQQHDEDLIGHVTEVATVLGGAGYSPNQIQRLVDLGGEISLDVQHQPHYENREESEAILRKRWGSEFDSNLKATRAAANKLGPKFIEWLDQGHGNNIVVCEILSALGRGDLSLGKAAAEAEIAKLRATPAMRDRFHRDHTLAVTRLRILANVAARGEETGAEFEAKVSKVLTDQIKRTARGEAPAERPAASKTGEGKIAEIRARLATVPNGSREWRELRVALNKAYAETYPGEQS